MQCANSFLYLAFQISSSFATVLSTKDQPSAQSRYVVPYTKAAARTKKCVLWQSEQCSRPHWIKCPQISTECFCTFEFTHIGPVHTRLWAASYLRDRASLRGRSPWGATDVTALRIWQRTSNHTVKHSRFSLYSLILDRINHTAVETLHSARYAFFFSFLLDCWSVSCFKI